MNLQKKSRQILKLVIKKQCFSLITFFQDIEIPKKVTLHYKLKKYL